MPRMLPRMRSALAAGQFGNPTPRAPVKLAPPLVLLLAIGVGFVGGCGDSADEQASTPVAGSSGAASGGATSGARIESFIVAPDYPTLVALLGQGHDRARERLGPHRLRYTATLTTGTSARSGKLDADGRVPDVPTNQPIHERFEVTDTLELLWASEPGGPAKLSLEQRNEHEHGRALILVDERAWTNLDGRGWFEQPLETDLWKLWADDAQHAVLDLVELAGPHADIGAIALEQVGGRPAVRVSLQPSEQRHPERIVDGLTPWRDDAEVRVVAASITLDRATGLWRHASVELDWSFEDSAHREVVGHARFEGSVDTFAQAPAIVPPAEAPPLLERDRPELLRERLLDGLAGP
jgi:hypothetical protein